MNVSGKIDRDGLGEKLRPTGLLRPGGWLIIVSYVLMVALVFCSAACIHEPKSFVPLIPWAVASAVVWGMNIVGFIKYAASKGYGGWTAFWLCTAQLNGFIVLLLLPDRNL